MPAYIIVAITIHNAQNYEGYKKLTPASIAAYDGKFIVRGGEAQILEGTWQPGRVVVLEFPTVEKAKQWWASEEYAPAKAMRQASSETQMILVEGLEG